MNPNWLIDLNESFEKATQRTRIQLLGANGKISLSIPVKKSIKGTTSHQIRIDYIQKWQNQHWRTIQSAYGKAPFFEYYQSEIASLYAQAPEFLFEFSVPLLKWVHIQFFSKGFFCDNLTQNSIEFQPDNIQSLSLESDNGVSSHAIFYSQVFGQNFVPGLSVLDYLFCCGPHFANRKSE